MLSGTLVVDASTRPQYLDLSHADGTRWEAVVEVDGATMRLNYVDASGLDPRPAACATSATTEESLVILRREERIGSVPPYPGPEPTGRAPMTSFLDQPRSVFLRRALFHVHLWVGVIAALYLVIVSITGAALVFRIDLQRAVHPHLFTPSGAGPLARPLTVLEAVAAAYPDGGVSGVDSPTTARPTYLAYVTTGERFHTVLIDPVSADILGELPEHSVVTTLQDLHFDLLAGPAGRVVNGIGGFYLLVLCVTGMVVWWPGRAGWRRGFTIDWSRPWKRVTWELHGAIGILAVVLVGMWAVTGIYFAFPTGFRAAVNQISPLTVGVTPTSDSSGAGTERRPTWGALIARARAVEPDTFVARVVVPATEESPCQVLFSDERPTPVGTAALRTVHLEQFTGERLAEALRSKPTLGDTIMEWIAPLHVGSFGGLGVKLAWLVTGLAPALLGAAGLILWWTQVVAPRWARPEREGVLQHATSASRGRGPTV